MDNFRGSPPGSPGRSAPESSASPQISNSTEMHASEAWKAIERLQPGLERALATGNVSLEKEVQYRFLIAEGCLALGAASQQMEESRLMLAAEHLDAVLRHTPGDFSQRPKALLLFCRVEFERHVLTNSRHSLSMSVKHGREAQRVADTLRLREHDVALYIDILVALGHSLSHQNVLCGDADDLDESIACRRQILACAAVNSETYMLALNNLASVLDRRHRDGRADEDWQEAVRLLRQLVASTPPDSALHRIGITQLGFLQERRYQETKSLQDLNEAMRQLKISECLLDDGHINDGRDSLLQYLAALHRDRHVHTADIDDLRQVTHYLNLRFHSLSPDHALKPDCLHQLLLSAHLYISSSHSLEVFEATMAVCKEAMSTMPIAYPGREEIGDTYTKMLGRLYAASGKLEHLDELLACVTTAVHRWSAMRVAGHTEQDVTVRGGHLSVKGLLGLVRRLRCTPPDSHARQLAEDEIHGVFLSTADYVDPKGIGFRPTFLYQLITYRTVILVCAAEDGISLDEDQIRLLLDAPNQEWEDRGVPVAREDWEREELRDKPFDDRDTRVRRIAKMALIHTLMGYKSNRPVSREEFIAREQRLEAEAFEQAMDKGGFPNSKLCRSCRTFLKFLHVTEAGFEFDSAGSLLPLLGDWRVLLFCRDHCALCRSLASLLTTPQGELEVDLGQTDEHARALTGSCGRLPTGDSFLRVMYGVTPVGELVLATEGSFRRTMRQGWEVADGLPLQEVMADPDGPICTTEGGQLVNPRQLQTWLRDCDYNHGRTCNHPRPGERIRMEIPLMCIDVVKDCLVDTTSKERYLALSYTWGQVDMHMTLRKNVAERRRPGGLAAIPFPRTIRDAIQLVRLMGERLLWIDAVCIVQDDQDQKARDIPRMDVVYGNAFVTIAAMYGDSADAGLPGVVPGSRTPQKSESFTVTRRSPALEHDPSSDENEDAHIVQTPRPFYLQLKRSTWNTRGWILQEHLLSRRCFFFTQDAVYFQCSKTTTSEGGVDQDLDAHFHGDAVPSTLRQHNHTNPLATMHSWHDLGTPLMMHRSLRAYMALVGLYTRRKFTHKSDIIDGFRGVLAVFDEYWSGYSTIDATALHGIPQAVFLHALLWSPADRIPRRGAKVMTLDDAKYEPGDVDLRFPSWSWAGWDGPVDFRLFEWLTRPHEQPIALARSIELDGRQVFPCPDDQSRVPTTDRPKPTETQVQTQTFATADAQDREADHATPDPGACDSSGAKASALEDGAGQVDQNVVDAEKEDAEKEDAEKEDAEKEDAEKEDAEKEDAEKEDAEKEVAKEDAIRKSSKGKEKETLPGDWVRNLAKDAKTWCDPDTGKTWVFGPEATRPGGQHRPPPAANVLVMTAPVASLESFTVDPHKEYFSLPDQPHVRGPQSVRRIRDRNGAHCGLWWQQYHYQWVGTGLFRDTEGELKMVGVSAYPVGIEPRRGFGHVGGAISIFDDEVFTRGSVLEQGLVNVLVIDGRDVARFGAACRCTVALIHPQAWEEAGPTEEVIRIA
ncbi:hypothetical protein RB597_006273 [Gaeumannomyces tritici]